MDRSGFKILEDDAIDRLLDADPACRHPLVTAIVLEIERIEGGKTAEETLHEAFCLVTENLGYTGASGGLRILSEALALFRYPDSWLRDCPLSASSQLSLLRTLGLHRGRGAMVSRWKEREAFRAAAAFVREVLREEEDSLARKLAKLLEAAFLFSQPPPSPPGPRRVAAAKSRGD
jgi:hypothetical protein